MPETVAAPPRPAPVSPGSMSSTCRGSWRSQAAPGSWATSGAEVIKVERPSVGDDTHGWEPPFVADASGDLTDLSAYFLAANRNKRSTAIDLANSAGVALVKRVTAISEVVIENYQPGDFAGRGLGHHTTGAPGPLKPGDGEIAVLVKRGAFGARRAEAAS